MQPMENDKIAAEKVKNKIKSNFIVDFARSMQWFLIFNQLWFAQREIKGILKKKNCECKVIACGENKVPSRI